MEDRFKGKREKNMKVMTLVLTAVVLIISTVPIMGMHDNNGPVRKSRRLARFFIPRISTRQGMTQSFQKGPESRDDVEYLVDEATRYLANDGTYTIMSMAIDNERYPNPSGPRKGEGHTFLVKHEGDQLLVYDGHEDHYFSDNSEAWELYRYLLSSIQERLGCAGVQYVDPESLFSSHADIQKIRKIREMDEGGCYLLAGALEEKLEKLHNG